MNAHIFVGQDSKITDVYKSKDNSGAEFLGAFQDQVRERGVPTKLTADNAPMYRGWNITKYLRDVVVSYITYYLIILAAVKRQCPEGVNTLY